MPGSIVSAEKQRFALVAFPEMQRAATIAREMLLWNRIQANSVQYQSSGTTARSATKAEVITEFTSAIQLICQTPRKMP
jgi:hypothetical protein